MLSKVSHFDWRYVLRIGLIAGVIALYTSVIGMVETFSQRSLISGWLTLGQSLLFAPAIVAGYLVANRWQGQVSPRTLLPGGLIGGFLAGLPLAGLVVGTSLINVRAVLVNVSPGLLALLTFGQGVPGSLITLGLMSLLGFIGAGLGILPARYRRPLLIAIFWTIGLGLMSELLIQILRPRLARTTLAYLFRGNALQPSAAIGLFAITAALTAARSSSQAGLARRHIANLAPARQQQLRLAATALGVLVLLGLPQVLGIYLSEVFGMVGMFILMGLGLNIAIGLAGLLDLGYVANFAIGAYVMALLTSTGPLGIAGWSFWQALPFSVLAAMTAGFLLALPVLRMRGDYLAIATLGFGEIIRILALSDWLAPTIGGAQGVLFIPKPQIADFAFRGPQEIYYLFLVGCFLVIFVSWRLNNSRIGRQWMAMREDEDAAQAMGINLIKTKILAFTLSAASGGLAGAIFAAKLSTIFPHSFQLLISLNVLALIIVGGMGSVPGVVVGAFFLVGLPELLREFAEYRLLLYGALLIIMMLARPEGLWPSPVRQRELHEVDEEAAFIEPMPHRPGTTETEVEIETKVTTGEPLSRG